MLRSCEVGTSYNRAVISPKTFQVASLTSKGLSAVCAVGETQQDKMEVDLIRNGQYQILFISPELLLVNLTWRDMIIHGGRS